MTEYIPLGTKVLLKKLPKPEAKKGSLILTTEPKEKMIAEVIKCGYSCNDLVKCEYLNKIVRYAPYTAQVIDEDNPDFLIVDEKDIWCIVRE